MKGIFSPKHKLRNPQSELFSGEIVESFEIPQRAEHVFQEFNKHFHVRKDIAEYVRQIADKNLMMTFAKIIINFFLSMFGKGDILKVF